MSEGSFTHSFEDIRNQINADGSCFTGLNNGIYTGCNTRVLDATKAELLNGMNKRVDYATNAWFGDGYLYNYDTSVAGYWHTNAGVLWTLPNMLAGSYSI